VYRYCRQLPAKPTHAVSSISSEKGLTACLPVSPVWTKNQDISIRAHRGASAHRRDRTGQCMCTSSYTSVPRSARGFDQQVDLARLDFKSTSARKLRPKRRSRAMRSRSFCRRSRGRTNPSRSTVAAATHTAAAVGAAAQAAAAAAGHVPSHAAVNHCRRRSRLRGLCCSVAARRPPPQPSLRLPTSPRLLPRAPTPSHPLAVAAHAAQ
jgi:hypothetical protein